MKQVTKQFIPSVNFHLWEPCNMRCKFCFAAFKDVRASILPKGHLPREMAIQVVQQLADFGFQKITFAGGEPTLCSWLPDLIATAKKSGLTTMIVSNGSILTDKFLYDNKKYLDWIAISVDSLNTDTNIATGRAVSGGVPLHKDYYFSLAERIKKFGYGFKVNTVVNQFNFKEDMTDFILISKPLRWKIFQVLPIVGQNDLHIESFKISEAQFEYFLKMHSGLHKITNLIPESNMQMKASYAMVDPAGRFYDNANGTHNYSRPILQVGVKAALKEVKYDFVKFIARGGQYDWMQKKEEKDMQ